MANEKKEEAVKAPVEKVDTAAKKDTVAPAAAPATVAKKPAAKKATTAKKPAAKKPAAKKATAAKKAAPAAAAKKAAPAAKKPAAKKATTAKKTAAKKPAKKAAKKVTPKLGKVIFEFDGQQIDYKAIEKKAAKLGGDVYVVANEKKIFDKDGKFVDLF